MTFEISLLILAYLIFFSCPIIFTRYEDYKGNLSYAVDRSLTELSISSNLLVDIGKVFIKNRYLVRQNISKISKYLGFSLAIILPFFTLNIPDEPIIEVLLEGLLIILNITVGSMIYMVSDILSYNKEPKVKVSAEELLTVYFNKEYPALQSFLIPIYINIGITNSRYTFGNVSPENKHVSYNSDRYHTKNYLSRFGHNLFLFTSLFEKALLEENSKSLFISEISKAENIEILAKLIVFLEDPALIKQLINETDNDSAILFNASLKRMISELDKSLKRIHREYGELQVLESKLDEHLAKERLDLLVKQSFNLIK